MKKRNIIGLVAAGLASLAGAGIYLNSKPVNVPAGNYAISENRFLSSEGFSICSGVIIDYGKGAIMAHAIPSFNKEDNLIGAGNVVKKLEDELNERGVNPRNCEAIVNAGTAGSLYRIRNDLDESGVKIREARLDGAGRNLVYDPVTNKLSIKYIK